MISANFIGTDSTSIHLGTLFAGNVAFKDDLRTEWIANPSINASVDPCQRRFARDFVMPQSRNIKCVRK